MQVYVPDAPCTRKSWFTTVGVTFAWTYTFYAGRVGVVQQLAINKSHFHKVVLHIYTRAAEFY